MVVYGYARVSTDDQNNSFEQQQKRIKEYYNYHESQDKSCVLLSIGASGEWLMP